jgi:HAD superfamily hydrolase (TIGR01509 family)
MQILMELRGAKIKIALGSSSKNAKLVLQRLGIINFFDFIADGHSVPDLKPAPDIFLYVAEALKIPPDRCLVIEDAPAGIIAALMAGMWVLGVGPFNRLAQAHLVLPTLAEISWSDILAKIN